MTGNPHAWPAGEAPSIEAPIRAAEVVGALSLATDLGTGQPLEHALRTAVLAVRLGELVGGPGRSPIAGSYEGRDAVFGQFGRYGGETASSSPARALLRPLRLGRVLGVAVAHRTRRPAIAVTARRGPRRSRDPRHVRPTM